MIFEKRRFLYHDKKNQDFCLKLLFKISIGEVKITEISHEDLVFLLRFLLMNLGEKGFIKDRENFNKESEKEKVEIILKKKLLLFENQLASLSEIDSYEIIIKSMENYLLSDNNYQKFMENIDNYFKDERFKEGIVIFLSNIFEPLLRKKIYKLFLNKVTIDKTFKSQYGSDCLKIIKAITFNQKDLNNFESLFE